MGFLGTAASPFADMALIFQLAGYAVLFSGGMYAKKKDLLKHIRMAEISVALGIIAFAWMSVSLFSNFQAHISYTLIGSLVAFHILTGGLALFAGVLFVFNRVIKKTRNPMRIVFFSWSIALVLGILVYVNYYISFFL